VKLDSIRGIAMEQSRLYRAWTNNKLTASELTRGVFALREIRCSLEAVPPAAAAETPTTIVIHSVPAGYHFRDVDGEQRLLLNSIEHEAAPQTMLEAPEPVSTTAPENIDRARDIEPEPVPTEEAQRVAELNTMSLEQLMVLANVDEG
jgi:hypothetical protein